MIRWTELASRDLEDIFIFIAKDDAKTAHEVVQRVLAAIEGLALFPGRGRPGRMTGTRELFVPHLPHYIVYRIVETEIQLVRILHVRRSWPQRNPHDPRENNIG